MSWIKSSCGSLKHAVSLSHSLTISLSYYVIADPVISPPKLTAKLKNSFEPSTKRSDGTMPVLLAVLPLPLLLPVTLLTTSMRRVTLPPQHLARNHPKRRVRRRLLSLQQLLTLHHHPQWLRYVGIIYLSLSLLFKHAT